MNLFDVIIVGSGPSGAIAGYTTASNGLRTLILDRSLFPRRKICGGGLTYRARNLIPFDISEIIHQEIHSGSIGFRGNLVKTIRDKEVIAYTIDRLSFDSFLLNKAVEYGAEAQLGKRVNTVKEQNDLIQVETNQETFLGKYLVGADGVHSTIAKTMGMIKNRPTSFAYEARLSREIENRTSQTEMITFDFGTILGGYGWIFPKQDHLNVGVCRTWPGKKASKKHLLRFVDQNPGLHRDRIIDIRAFPVPLGGKKFTLHRKNILLVGDAANLADPWLGEGLYYALFSGRLAAETIISHNNSELLDLAAYTQKINETCVEQFKYARKFSLIVNALPYINVQLLQYSKTLQKVVINLLRGDMTYQEAWQSVMNLIPKFLRQKLRGEND
jgi:geranylgeranyl reductase family protein